MTKDEYKLIIQERFDESRDLYEASKTPEEYMAWFFLAEDLFDFDLYDSGECKWFAHTMLEVIRVILEKKNYEFINAPERYRTYLLMVNMPFLKDKLEWGTSVRGAWWAFSGPGHEKTFSVRGITDVPYKDTEQFMRAVLEWAEENAK